MAEAAFWNIWEVPRKDRVFRGQNPLVMDFSDEQLRQRYRFGRDSIMYLSDLLRDQLERLTRRKTSLTVEEKVMIALRFFASGSHLQVIGDTMGHDKSTISRVTRQFADALVEKKDTFIKWPQTPEKLSSIKNGFYQKAGFPNVVRCMGLMCRLRSLPVKMPYYRGYCAPSGCACAEHTSVHVLIRSPHFRSRDWRHFQ